MENYKVIQDYLRTFPKGTSVDDVLASFDKAEELKKESNEKLMKELEKYNGKVYFHADTEMLGDECLIPYKAYFKITGSKQTPRGGVVLTAQSIEINEWSIEKMDEFTLVEKDLESCKEIEADIFDTLISKVDWVLNYPLGK